MRANSPRAPFKQHPRRGPLRLGKVVEPGAVQFTPKRTARHNTHIRPYAHTLHKHICIYNQNACAREISPVRPCCLSARYYGILCCIEFSSGFSMWRRIRHETGSIRLLQITQTQTHTHTRMHMFGALRRRVVCPLFAGDIKQLHTYVHASPDHRHSGWRICVRIMLSAGNMTLCRLYKHMPQTRQISQPKG